MSITCKIPGIYFKLFLNLFGKSSDILYYKSYNTHTSTIHTKKQNIANIIKAP